MNKVFLLLLILLCSFLGEGQTAYLKTVAGEEGVGYYELQKSVDNKNWQTIETILPQRKEDTNTYSINIPNETAYFRFKAETSTGQYFTNAIKMQSTQDSAVVFELAEQVSRWQDNLIFAVENQVNVQYYSIQRSTSSTRPYFREIERIRQTLSTTYKRVYIRNIPKKPTYRVIAVYVNGQKSTPVVFK